MNSYYVKEHRATVPPNEKYKQRIWVLETPDRRESLPARNTHINICPKKDKRQPSPYYNKAVPGLPELLLSLKAHCVRTEKFGEN